MVRYFISVKVVVIILSLLSFCFIESRVIGQDQLQENYNVNHYHIIAEVTDTSTYIKATTNIKFEVLYNSDSLFFDFGDQLNIEELLLDGNQVEYLHTGNKLILLGNYIKENQTTLSVKYNGDGSNPNGDEAIYNREYKPYGRFTYTLTEPYSTRYWIPCKEILTDKADSVFVDLIVPEGLMAGSVGSLINTNASDTGWVEYQWRSHYPTAFYLISFAVGDYMNYTFTYSGIDTFPIVNFIYNSEEFLKKEKSRIDTTKYLLDIFYDLFGAYPFNKEKYGHCIAPVGGGMEHQTMTTLGNFGFTLVAHELAHQWFGNYVTCSSWNHIWINEGFASYAEYLSLEYLDSKERADNWMGYAHELALNSINGSVYVPDNMLDDPARIFSYSNTYKKGAAILHMLRAEINNDELFFDGLKSYLQKYSFGNASADDFRDHMEVFCGIDLNIFFNQWYYGNGFPIIDIEWYQMDDELVIITKQRTSNPETTSFFNLKLPVFLEFPDGDTTIILQIDEPVKVLRLKMKKPVYNLHANPDNSVLVQINSLSRIDTVANIQLNDLLLFPNPAGDAIKVFSIIQHQPLNLYFYSTNGTLVKSLMNITPNGSSYNISDLETGLYMVSIGMGNKQAFLKLIKS